MFKRQPKPEVTTHLTISNIDVQLTRKKMKSLRLAVRAPYGKVTLSAPHHVTFRSIQHFVTSKQNWILEQQQKFSSNPPPTPKTYITGEIHLLFNQPHTLRVSTAKRGFGVTQVGQQLQLITPENASVLYKEKQLQNFYRAQLRIHSNTFISAWEQKIGVKCQHLYIQKMKSRWGSCNYRQHTIRLSLELAQKPLDCLNYVILHELVHFWEANHGPNFHAHVAHFMPDWQTYEQELNNLALRKL